MQNIKKYFMTLALLIIAVTGAWAADTYTITFKANNKTKTIENVTLPHTFMSVNNQGNGELDLIINDLYNQSEGWCVETPTVSGNSNVTAGLDGSYNQYITISAPFEGNATVSAMHFYNIPISSFTYTLEISVESPAIEVKWDAATKSGTFVMPGSNVELQVEYYPESNLFLGKEALKDKANISVLNGETAVAFDDAGKSTSTVTEGNTVTAKFTGKKVLGMKVEKKGAASKLASEVTPDDIFKVIASDGMIYDNIAAAESAGTVAQGLVVYVGSNTGNATYTHGMALALQDEANNTWSGAKDACNAKNTSTPIVGALWIQASKDQWNTMFNAVGGDSKLRDCFSSAGGTNLIKFGNYWSSSSHEDYGEQGDFYMFSEDDWPGDWGSTSVYYNDNYHVRACIVF